MELKDIITLLLKLFVFCLFITVCLGDWNTGYPHRYCPSYCNSTGDWVDVQDCGDMGWCCGKNHDPTCCTDYFELLLDFPENKTEDQCLIVKEELEEFVPLGGADTPYGQLQQHSLLMVLAATCLYLVMDRSFA